MLEMSVQVMLLLNVRLKLEFRLAGLNTVCVCVCVCVCAHCFLISWFDMEKDKRNAVNSTKSKKLTSHRNIRNGGSQCEILL